MSKNIGVGILGVGFMGKVHLEAYQAAARAGFPCDVVAVCDRQPERRRGEVEAVGNLDVGRESTTLFDPNEVTGYAEPADLLADDRVDAVSICTRTETHVELALACLAAGKHVLVEKPVAIETAEVERLARAAAASDLVAMPAMCVRFWPGWSWLLDRVRDGRHGRVLSATFHRLSSPPSWSTDFYGDEEKSGGALTDLHIHDVDFVRACFGDPDDVVSTGSAAHVTTLYRYRNGPRHVVAEGGWDHTPGFPFRMRFVVVFEDGTADYDITRDQPLILARNGESEPIDLGTDNGYDGEIRHFVRCVRGEASPRVTMDDAVAVARLLDRERASLDRP